MVDIFFQIIFDNFEYPVANHLEKVRQMFLNNPNQGYIYFFRQMIPAIFLKKIFFPRSYVCLRGAETFVWGFFSEIGEIKRYFGLNVSKK